MLKCNEINCFLIIVTRYMYFKRIKKLIANKTTEAVIPRKKTKQNCEALSNFHINIQEFGRRGVELGLCNNYFVRNVSFSRNASHYVNKNVREK